MEFSMLGTSGIKISSIIISRGRENRDGCLPVLKAYHKVRRELEKLRLANLENRAVQSFYNDLIGELARLVPESFVNLYEMERLVHVERYIKSMQIRVQRGVVDFEKDQAKLKEVKTFSASLDKLVKALSPNASDEKRQAIEEFFWMIEEYKVSVFAQELKTAVPVSRKRLENKLAEISRMV